MAARLPDWMWLTQRSQPKRASYRRERCFGWHQAGMARKRQGSAAVLLSFAAYRCLSFQGYTISEEQFNSRMFHWRKLMNFIVRAEEERTERSSPNHDQTPAGRRR